MTIDEFEELHARLDDIKRVLVHHEPWRESWNSAAEAKARELMFWLLGREGFARAGDFVALKLSRPEAFALIAVARLMSPLTPFQADGDPLPAALRTLESAVSE